MQLLKDLYDRAEALKGRRLIVTTGILSVFFLGVGIFIGHINNLILTLDEPVVSTYVPSEPRDLGVIFEGKITYTNPEYYPDEGISYVLTDSSGKDIILLKSDDDKLSIAEGLFVKAKGLELVTKSGIKYLLVKEIIINAAD